jgi:hypothetical protein
VTSFDGHADPLARRWEDDTKLFEFGGYTAAVVLVAFGIAALVLGINGRSTVSSNLEQEQIYGSGDMTPQAIAGEVDAARSAQTKLVDSLRSAGVSINPSPIDMPGCSVADKLVDSGSRARCFAEYRRVHTFESTSGLTYSQMARYTAREDAPLKATDGLGGTNDPQYAVIDSKTHQPVSNGRRDIWVTYTGADDGAQLGLHGRPALGLRDRGRDRLDPVRCGLRDPRLHRLPVEADGVGLASREGRLHDGGLLAADGFGDILS